MGPPAPDAEPDDGESQPEARDQQLRVEAARSLRRKDTRLHEPHAEKHQSERAPEERERDRLRVHHDGLFDVRFQDRAQIAAHRLDRLVDLGRRRRERTAQLVPLADQALPARRHLLTGRDLRLDLLDDVPEL